MNIFYVIKELYTTLTETESDRQEQVGKWSEEEKLKILEKNSRTLLFLEKIPHTIELQGEFTSSFIKISISVEEFEKFIQKKKPILYLSRESLSFMGFGYFGGGLDANVYFFLNEEIAICSEKKIIIDVPDNEKDFCLKNNYIRIGIGENFSCDVVPIKERKHPYPYYYQPFWIGIPIT